MRPSITIHRPIVIALIIVVVGLAAYAPSFSVPFQLDDSPNIRENPLVTQPGLFLHSSDYCSRLPEESDQSVVCKFFKTRFVGYASFAVNHAVHGLDPWGYHAVNFVIHIVNALVVAWLVILTFRTPVMRNSISESGIKWMALAVGLFFVSHPLQTQAVTYIVQRFASLATSFYLLSVTLYVKWRLAVVEKSAEKRNGSWWFYGASLLSAVLGMWTKEIAFTAPLAATLYEGMFFEGAWKRRIVGLLPLISTMALIPLNLLHAGNAPGEMLGEMQDVTRLFSTLSRPEYLWTEMRVMMTYLRLLAIPVGQNLDYDYPVSHSFFSGPVLLSFACIVLLLGLGMYWHVRSRTVTARLYRLASFGVLWFFLALLVESSVIPIVDVIFEHRVYLPSVGFFVAAVVLCYGIVDRARKRGISARPMAAVALACVVILFAGLTHARNKVWQSDVSLWEDVVKKSPGKSRGYNNLGRAYFAANKINDAIHMYEKALRLDSRNYQALNNLGMAYYTLGSYERAAAAYRAAIYVMPGAPVVHNNLGMAYFQLGQLEESEKSYSLAVSLDPFYAQAYNNRGAVYGRRKEYNRAIEDFSRAISIAPGFAGYYLNRGVAYASMGAAIKASADYQAACERGNEQGCISLRMLQGRM